MSTLLVDGDIFCYQIASACEVETDWGDDLWTLHSDAAEAKTKLDSYLTDLLSTLSGTEIIVALTHHDNFRKSILPSYKSNRQGVRKPLCLKALKAHCANKYDTFIRPGLEADDVLGILSTSETLVKGERIIVSIDKDLKSIPGKLYDPKQPELGIVEVSENEADYWHMYQTLCGDATDGYKGCPGCGPKTAEKILESTTDWWPAVVKAYKKAGLGEEEALTQARIARILRSSDYDFKLKQPILWSPEKAMSAA